MYAYKYIYNFSFWSNDRKVKLVTAVDSEKGSLFNSYNAGLIVGATPFSGLPLIRILKC